MARRIDMDKVQSVYACMLDNNVGPIMGLSIPAIVESTGMSYKVVSRIVSDGTLGFKESRRKTNTGATTYYHSMEDMLTTEEYKGVEPADLDSHEMREHLVNNLVNSLAMVDPMHELIPKSFNDRAPVGNAKGKQRKTFWDYYATEKQTKFLNDTLNLKETQPKFDKNLETIGEGDPMAYLQKFLAQENITNESMARTLLMFARHYLNKIEIEN